MNQHVAEVDVGPDNIDELVLAVGCGRFEDDPDRIQFFDDLSFKKIHPNINLKLYIAIEKLDNFYQVQDGRKF